MRRIFQLQLPIESRISPQQTHSAYPALTVPFYLPLTVLPQQPCSYFPDRPSQLRAFAAHHVPSDAYHKLMDAGFRRSGKFIYQPMCPRCRDCVPMRVPVESFRPSKSQRRCWRRNTDLAVSVEENPTASDEKFDLYLRYVRQWHGHDDSDRESFESFLYDSPVKTIDFTYRSAEGKLLAVGICDVSEQFLSSVYFYFDPAEHKRGVGTFGALKEIEYARQGGIPHYYLGYWIAGCATMQYKDSFRPAEFLGGDGIWRNMPPRDGATASP